MRKLMACAASAGIIAGLMLAPVSAYASTVNGPLQGTGISNTIQPADSDPNTTMTFTVTAGALSLTAPASANLGSGAPGGTVSGQIGAVTVTDNRALLLATWTATASSTIWSTGAGTPGETIPASAATYAPGLVTTTGVIVAIPTTITLSTAPQAVVQGSAGVGNNSATWNPTITVAIPVGSVGGLYTSTLTQSVS
jgi:hypothetical protein